MLDGGGPCWLNRWRTPHECSSYCCPTDIGSSSDHCNSFIIFQHCSRNRSVGNDYRWRKSFDRRTRCNHSTCSFWSWWRISSEWLWTQCRWTDSWTMVNLEKCKNLLV